MATYEFISLKCVSQNELGGDEIFVEYGGVQVYPKSGFGASFSTNDVVVNGDAILGPEDRERLLGIEGASPVEAYEGVDSFLRTSVPTHGLVIQVWERDLLSANDLLGKVIVFPNPTGGPVLKRLDGPLTGVYELTYQVL
ncbi:MAG: hypothetical protein VX498_07265 [Myxococcota bacterium]|nr:hypothetical protein [Myxococcota bacterium]